MASSEPILIIDDDSNDALLLQTALREVQTPNPLTVLADGKAALNYLAGLKPFDDRGACPRPALVLLDLKLPALDGYDVLRWLKAHPQLKASVPVVVMTSDQRPGVPRKVVALGADQLVQKPLSYKKLVELMGQVKSRWLDAQATRGE